LLEFSFLFILIVLDRLAALIADAVEPHSAIESLLLPMLP
jgi:hypothetical protein